MSIRLLIADDAPFIREVVRNIIKKHDIEIVGEASNGQEAVEMAMTTNPDVILMDIVMPEKNGIEATQEIKKLLPEARIVAFSTETHSSMVLQAVEAGACDYVYKPFKEEEIIRALKQAHEGGKS